MRWGKVTVRILLKMLVAIVGVLLIVTLLLNVPAVQTYLTSHISNYLEKKLETVVRVEGVKIALPKTVVIKGLYIEDQNRDTLLLLGELGINVSLFGLLRNEVNAKSVHLETLVSHVHRKAPENEFNFQFIIDAFSPTDTLPVSKQEPEGDTKPWDFSVSEVNLKKINVSYYDDEVGIDARLQLGELNIDVGKIDPFEMIFMVEDLAMKNTMGTVVMWDVEYKNQEGENPVEPDSTNTGYRLPEVGLKNLLIENVNLSYKHRDWQYDFRADIGNLEFESEKVDLNEQEIKVNTLFFRDSDLSASMPLTSENPASLPTIDSTNISGPVTFTEIPNPFPDWDISVKGLDLNKINLKLNDVNSSASGEGMDVYNLQVDDLALELKGASITSKDVAAKIGKLSFAEKSGFNLINLACEVSASDQSVNIQKLKIKTPYTNIRADATVKMASISSLIDNAANTHISFDLEKSTLGIKDVLLFVPSLAENDYIENMRGLSPTAKIIANGTLQDLQFDVVELNIDEGIGVQLSGKVKNLIDYNRLSFDINLDTLYTNKSSLYGLLDSAIFNGIAIPQKIGLYASAAGTSDSLSAKLKCNTSFGDFNADAYFFNPGDGLRDTFNLDLKVKNFDADEYIADTTLGLVNLELGANGSGVLSDSISADVLANILQPGYMGYQYGDILLSASMRDSTFKVSLESDDPNATFNFNANAILTKGQYHLDLDLDLPVLNLRALNFVSDQIALKTHLNVNVNYRDLDNLDAEIMFSHFDIFQNGLLMPVTSASIITKLTPDSSQLNVQSPYLDMDIKSNISSVEMEPVFRSAIQKYFNLKDTMGLPPGKNLEFEIQFTRNESVNLPFLPEIKKLNINTFSGQYNSNRNQLVVKLDAPELIYNDIEVDSILVLLEGAEDSLSVQVGFKKLSIDSLYINRALARGEIRNGEISSTLKIENDTGLPEFLVASNVEVTDNDFRIGILPEGLIFGGERWQVPPGNFLMITQDSIYSENFSFGNQEQQLEVIINDNDADLLFDNFNINNLTGIFTYGDQQKLMYGGLDGKVGFPGQANDNHLLADIQFKELYILDTLAGNLEIKTDYKADLLVFDVKLDNALNKIFLGGSINQKLKDIDLKMTLGLSDISRLERFTLGEVSQMSGAIDGELEINGTLDDPDPQGYITFKNSKFNITKLNFATTLENESLRFDKRGIHFDEFVILDDEKDELILNGSLLTKNLKDFAFDLHVHTDKFKPVYSTSEDNSRFYGTLLMGADFKIKGDMDIPNIEANININKETNLTYVLPGSEIEIITPEGTVNFVNPNPGLDSLFTGETGDYFTDSIISKFQGLDLSANLKLHPEAKFTLVIDPTSGDYLTVGGNAFLNFSSDQSGSQSMTGIFEVSDGFYQISFYGLVKKSFTIEPGSSIAWSGRPMDANLNITAKHIVRTASTALVANESGSLSQAELNMFKTRLPYEVLLNIRGFLSEPKVSFNIDLAEKDLINYPMVASKLARLNTPEMQSELNKQVFALLVTGTFIADNPVASSGTTTENIATTAARNSVNGILADQLNNVSNQYIKYVDLNFGLTTFEDYSSGSGDTRTELDVQVSKKFMDDRLVVEATGTFDLEGDNKKYTGQTSQHMYGEFSVTYDLTESREYKIRAFRENAYDIFDGEIAYSGFALIFEKSFDSIKRKDKKKKSKNKKKRNKDGVKEEEIGNDDNK